MSRESIRTAVAAFLAPPAIPSMATVLRSQPRDLKGLTWGNGSPGQTSSVIAVVAIQSQTEAAHAVDGAGGGRQTQYVVGVQVYGRSIEMDAQLAADAFDTSVEAVLNRLRSDPWLGLGQAAAQAQGLLSSAYSQLDVEFGEPELETPDGGAIFTFALVRFAVQEWNQVT